MRRALAAPLVALALAPACTLGPAYQRPKIATPESLPQKWRDQAAADPATLANTPWWDLYQDPALQDLLRTALRENRDLKIAAERIVEARAQLGFGRADLFPQVDLSASASRNAASRSGAPPIPEPQDNRTTVYDLSLPVRWELDLFGRVRRSNEAARAQLVATEEGRRAVAVALVAQVAGVYVDLRTADLQLEIARRTAESREKAAELARTRFEGGVTSEKDWRQAEAELFRTRAIAQGLEQRVLQAENLLSLLVGRFPGEVLRGREVREMAAPPALPAGLTTEIVERRPDLRSAEQQLVAANASIGAAKALLFPRIALTGDFGFRSTDLGTLLEGPSKAWSIAASLLQPVFDAGRNRRRVEITESQMRQALYGYEQAVLQAFREVEDAIVAYRRTGEQRASQAARVRAERTVLELAELRYAGGVANYLEVLDAQRSLLGAELDEAQATGAHVGALVSLYRSLGGGWPSGPGEPAAAATTAEKTAAR